MPLIPYPMVADYQGVPFLARLAFGVPKITLQIVPQQDWLINQTSDGRPWGIYTLSGSAIYTPTNGGTLSVVDFGFTRSMQVSDFPVESDNTNQGSAFATFNKVYQPSNPVLTFAMSGNETEKSAFLKAIDAACTSTTLFNVSTPDAVYQAPLNACTVERYSYRRSATRGATMLYVEVSLRQVLQVTLALTNVSLAPQSPSAATQVSNGNTQANTVPTSILAGAFGGKVFVH